MNNEINNIITNLDDLKIVIGAPTISMNNNDKIPASLLNFFGKYQNEYGSYIFGSNENISVPEKYARRICLSRYQYSQLKNAYLISRSILENNYKFFESYLDLHMEKMLNMFQSELYTINNKFEKEIFVLHFLILTTDFTMPPINKFEHSTFLEKSYVNMVYDFIMSIIKNGNIRNKLFIYLALSKILHCVLIRKLFMVFYVQEVGSNTTILLKYGINGNKITMDNLSSNTSFNFDVKAYCKKYALNYDLIEYRYQVIKELVPLKKDDIGTDSIKTYLFDVMDKNIKFVFLMYLYEDFKYGIRGRVRFDWDKIKPKDYILVPETENIIYPQVDVYEFYRRRGDSISFLDRGVDTQRMSVYDEDNIFLESFKKGEPVLAGASGHTADILLCAGYLEPSTDINNFVNAMKLMVIICVAVMFPRKDHSIFEMYRTLQLFNAPFHTNIFTCSESYARGGSCYKWLLENNNFTVNNNGQIYEFDGDTTYKHLTKLIEKDFDYYLSAPYKKIIDEIINLFYSNDKHIVNINNLRDKNYELTDDNFLDVNGELFIIFSIMRREGEKLWMNDGEYAYNIEKKHLAIRDFINNNYTVPELLTNDDIFLYEDDIVTCTRSVNDIIKPFDDFDNNCLVLQKIFRKLSKSKCLR
jgi:hypothetical protein